MDKEMFSYGRTTGADAAPIDAARLHAMRRGAGAYLLNVRFLSFALVNAFLFLRPGEVFPQLEGLRLYQVALIVAVFLYRVEVFALLSKASLMRSPITFCVLGIAGVTMISIVLRGDKQDVQLVANDCFNFVVYFLLMLAAIDTPERLKRYLLLLSGLIIAVTLAGMGQYFGLWNANAPAYRELQDYRDSTGQEVYLNRLCGFGIFNNPNDLARSIVVGAFLCLWGFGNLALGMLRYLWLIPLTMFVYAMQLTYSRGGFLALIAGTAMLLYRRFGRTKSLIIGVALAPIMLVGFAGRLTNLDMSGGTGQDRVKLWRDAFEEMQAVPVLGMGVGKFSEKIGLVAHNSFVQAYVETGFVGGTLFAAAFYLAIWMPWRALSLTGEAHAALLRFYPFLLAIVAGSVVGMFSSTRNQRVDTYLLLGLSAVFLQLLQKQNERAVIAMDVRMVARIVCVGALVLIAFNVYVRIAAN